MSFNNKHKIHIARGSTDKLIDNSTAINGFQSAGQPVYNKDRHYLTLSDRDTLYRDAAPINARTIEGWTSDIDTGTGRFLLNKTTSGHYILTGTRDTSESVVYIDSDPNFEIRRAGNNYLTFDDTGIKVSTKAGNTDLYLLSNNIWTQSVKNINGVEVFNTIANTADDEILYGLRIIDNVRVQGKKLYSDTSTWLTGTTVIDDTLSLNATTTFTSKISGAGITIDPSAKKITADNIDTSYAEIDSLLVPNKIKSIDTGIEVLNNLLVDGTANVEGAVTLNNTLWVANTSEFRGNMAVKAGVDITGNIKASTGTIGTLTVDNLYLNT